MKEFGEETINTVSIAFNNKKEKNYKIGEINLFSKKMDERLLPGDIHYLSYSSNDIYRKEIKNDTDSPVVLKEIKLENKHLKFENININGEPLKNKITIKPGESIKVEADLRSTNKNALYIVSPKYTYQHNNKEYSYHFDPSVMNVLELNEGQLANMLAQ